MIPILEKLFASSISVAEWGKKGFLVADNQQLASRMEICKQCEFWNHKGFGGTGSCQKCGCSTQARLRMSTSKCPIDKWGQVNVRQED